MLDIRFALRMLARRPGVPAVLAGLFALSLGLASGLWAVIDAVALRPLPYRDGDRLVMVMESHPARGLMVVTPANFLDWEGRVQALQDVAGTGGLEASVVGHGAAVRVIGTRVTERFFVVSSFRNGLIWYNRCNFARRTATCVLINYPASEKKQWDAVVTRISNSLSKG